MTISKLDVRVPNTSRPEVLMPVRKNPTDAGLDLMASKYSSIDPGCKELIDTGVQVRIPAGYVGLLVARSSLQKKSLMLANNVGVIDAGYRGNLFVALINYSNELATLDVGDRFAQLLIIPVALPVPNLVDEFNEDWENTTRGTNGFGSTGTN